jgi:hypothetical protein
MAATPESDSSPANPPLGLGGGARLSHASRSMSSRPLHASGPFARRLACRRRALETVEKVVTAFEWARWGRIFRGFFRSGQHAKALSKSA